MRNNKKTFRFAFCDDSDVKYDVTDKDVNSALKVATTTLEYPATWGTLIERMDKHFLQGDEINVLVLGRYNITEISEVSSLEGRVL